MSLHGIDAEPHGAALLLDVALLGEQVDDRVRREGVELGRVGVSGVEHLAGDVDDGALHAEAEPEIRDQVLAGVPRGEHLALDAAMAEAARHDDAVDTFERRHVLVEVLAVDPDEVEVGAAVDRRVAQGLDDADVRVRHLDVLADDRDAHARLGRRDARAEVLPLGEIRWRGIEVEQLHDVIAEPGVLEHQRHLVDGARVRHVDHGAHLDVTEERDLLLERLR